MKYLCGMKEDNTVPRRWKYCQPEDATVSKGWMDSKVPEGWMPDNIVVDAEMKEDNKDPQGWKNFQPDLET